MINTIRGASVGMHFVLSRLLNKTKQEEEKEKLQVNVLQKLVLENVMEVSIISFFLFLA